MAEMCKLCIIPALFLLSFGFVSSRSSPYARRAQSDCYIPTGVQYNRSLYYRTYGRDLSPLPAGYRISNGKRIATICNRDQQGDMIMHSSVHRCVYKKWKPEIPNCIEHKRCENAPNLHNAVASEKWAPEKTYPHGQTVTYTCEANHLLIGNNTIRCEDGHWTDHNFHCEGLGDYLDYLDLCSDYVMTNADLIRLSLTLYQVTCHYGYELSFENDVFECEQGQWVNGTPHCYPKPCPKIYEKYEIVLDANNTDVPFADRRRSLEHGVSVKIQCPNGQLPFKNVQTAHCRNAKWVPFRPVCRRSCTISRRYRPYARFTYPETNENVGNVVGHGQKIHHRCFGDRRYTVKRCSNGRWRPWGLKRCRPVFPDMIPDVDNNNVYSESRGDKSGCKLIPGDRIEYTTTDGLMAFSLGDVIEDGEIIQQVCKDAEGVQDTEHLTKCSKGTWLPDLIACPNRDCEIHVNSSEVRTGVLRSPGNTIHFPRNTICNYHFHMDQQEKVKVTFMTFNISGTDSNCSDSYLAYNSSEGMDDIVKFCGEELPDPIEVYGIEVLLILNTLRADVAYFEALFEIVADEPSCPSPDIDGFLYYPRQASYEVNATVNIHCESERHYIVGSLVWICQENGEWLGNAECVELHKCQLPEKAGISYQVGDIIGVSGEVEHGTIVYAVRYCDADFDRVDNLSMYQTLDCDNGTLSDGIIECQEENEGSVCSPPPLQGVHFTPIKESYNTTEKITITGCVDALSVPYGSHELVCLEDGTWLGVVQCLGYCENGANYIQQTEYSFFRRPGVTYHQLSNVDSHMSCFEECTMYEGFVCRSIEYRSTRKICILVDKPPNGDQFEVGNGINMPQVYGNACDDRCHIPSPMSGNMVIIDDEGIQYVDNQRVLSGRTLTVICKQAFASEYMTCIGGHWDKEFNWAFCDPEY